MPVPRHQVGYFSVFPVMVCPKRSCWAVPKSCLWSG